jgi:hypothetical protein
VVGARSSGAAAAAYHLTWLGALDLNAYRSVPGRDTMGQFAVTVGLADRSNQL